MDSTTSTNSAQANIDDLRAVTPDAISLTIPEGDMFGDGVLPTTDPVSWRLTEGGGDLVIGRDVTGEKFALHIKHLYVSRVHARIWYLDGQYHISDCLLTHGTLVGAEPEHRARTLKNRNIITLTVPGGPGFAVEVHDSLPVFLSTNGTSDQLQSLIQFRVKIARGIFALTVVRRRTARAVAS